MKQKVRLGIVGLGYIGQIHAQSVLENKVPGLFLAAVNSRTPEKTRLFPDTRFFSSPQEMIESGLVDAILVATPHYQHSRVAILALERGLHVLVEKPVGVHRLDVERMLSAHGRRSTVFAAMFNQRTDPACQELKRMLLSGDLGVVNRVSWTVTDIFRPEIYYRSGGWRGTWRGEGGGILLNQCAHALDMHQWLFGMPQRVQGFCQFGRYHRIEVEDDVAAHFEYSNGCHATFVASSGEAPGTNRLELAAESGRIVLENGALQIWKTEVPVSRFSAAADAMFARPRAIESSIEFPKNSAQHVAILQNFTDAILRETPLIAPAVEGIHSVNLATAILYSSGINSMVDVPLDGETYCRWLEQKIEAAGGSSRV